MQTQTQTLPVLHASHAFPWHVAADISQLEFSLWEAMRMLINAGECAGHLTTEEQFNWLNLLSAMFVANMRDADDLMAIQWAILNQEVAIA